MKRKERKKYLQTPCILVDQESDTTLVIDGHKAEVDFALVSMRRGRSKVAHLAMELSRDQMEELANYAVIWCEHLNKFYLGEGDE